MFSPSWPQLEGEGVDGEELTVDLPSRLDMAQITTLIQQQDLPKEGCSYKLVIVFKFVFHSCGLQRGDFSLSINLSSSEETLVAQG